MATLKSVIDMVDEIKPNAFSNEAKTQWLNECEGLVQTEVLLSQAKRSSPTTMTQIRTRSCWRSRRTTKSTGRI